MGALGDPKPAFWDGTHGLQTTTTEAPAPAPGGPPAGAPPAVPVDPSINPWTGLPDPNYYKGSYGGQFYTGPGGNIVYVPPGGKVGDYTDATTGLTYHNVVLGPTDAGLQPYTGGDASLNDPTTVKAAQDSSDVHRNVVKTAGSAEGLGFLGGAVGGVVGGLIGGPVGLVTGAYSGYKTVSGAKRAQDGQVDATELANAGTTRTTRVTEGDPNITVSNVDPTNGGGTGGGGGGGVNTKPLSDYTTTLINDAKNFKPMTAPTVQAPNAVNATTINAPNLDFKAGLTAGQVGPQDKVTAQKVWDPTGVQAQQVGIPGGVSAGTVTAERIGGMTAAPVKDITLEGTRGRDAQYDALGMLKGAADGTAPSQAQWLLQKGVDQGVGAAYGLAASLQGRNAGLALRTGQTAAKNAIATSAADMAALRADEMAKARGAYSTAAGQLADQDYKVLASNQTKDLTLSVENLKSQIDIAKANQSANLAAGQSNAANDLTAKIETMKAQLDAAKSNADRSLNADIATMTAKLDASKADAANQLKADLENAAAELKRLTDNRDAALRADDANQVANLNAAIERMKGDIDVKKSNQSALLDAAKATASNTLSANTSTADLGVKTQQVNNEQDYNLKNLGLTGLIGQLSAEQAAAKIAADTEAARLAFKASLYGTTAKVGTALATAAYGAYSTWKKTHPNSSWTDWISGDGSEYSGDDIPSVDW